MDQTIHVRLEGIAAIHIDWKEGAPFPGHSLSAESSLKMDLSPRRITAFFVGLKSRIAAFRVQRFVNQYPEEPLLAILPGVAMRYALLIIGQPFILSEFGLFIAIGGLSLHELMLIAVVGLAGVLIGVIPGCQIYRYALADGMTIRL